MKESKLPAPHAAVWLTLRLLDDNERMTSSQIMEHTGIKEKRDFFKIIRELRRFGYPIGSCKQEGKKGYYEARTQEQIEETIKGFAAMIADLTETANKLQELLSEKKDDKAS